MIWSVAAIKALPEFAQQPEEIIELNLAAAEQMVHSITGNTFAITAASFEAAVVEGVLLGMHSAIKADDTVIITGSAFNDGYYMVKGASLSGVTQLDPTPLDEPRVRCTLVRYPADVRAGVLGLLKWDVQNRAKAGIKSETISRHSVTYAEQDKDSVGGYPPELTAFLRPHRKART
jgi:hypothetical protein